MSNLVLNGDFSSRGDHWTFQTTTFDGNVANVANIGHIKQAITLDAPLKKGDAVRIKFKVNAMYGDVIQNGTFSNPGIPGEHWTTGGNTSFTNGKANMASIGHVKQLVTLDRPLVKGDIVKVNFTISDLYGSVTVSLQGISYPAFTTAGAKELALPISSDHTTNENTLKFQASNAFGLDNVEMIVCL